MSGSDLKRRTAKAGSVTIARANRLSLTSGNALSVRQIERLAFMLIG